jgi:redox-sensitive bicupin YhaK (pirin superfamily)
MIRLRPSSERGHADHGWLLARHSFSFADYHDPDEMGWGCLRVLNEDRIQPGRGFGMHGHRDMEVVTYLLAGSLEHRDSLGNGGVIGPGEVQRMSAGRGILHSEFNPSLREETHLLQIWIEPARRGTPASYEQKVLSPVARRGRLSPVATPDGAEGSLSIGQDARIHAALLAPGERLVTALDPGRLAYVHLVSGALSLNGLALEGGDGAKVADEGRLEFSAAKGSEILFFDLPPGGH